MIELINHTKEKKSKEGEYTNRWYQNIFISALKVLGKQSIRLTVIMVDEDEMRKLHASYYGSYRVTDVLSFTYEPQMPHEKKQGEIFICIPQTHRQAERYRVSFQSEMKRLFIHGLLHIYGYDHKKIKERKEMMSLARKIQALC